MASRITDGELNELTSTLVRGTILKLDERNPPQLTDGRYFLHRYKISAKGHAKWSLSIYRNVITPENDLEIAVDPWPLVWPSDSPERYRAALRWFEQQKDLEHLPSGIHIKDQRINAFRIGLKLDGAKEFVHRLQQQIVIKDPQRRWLIGGSVFPPFLNESQPRSAAPPPAGPALVVVEQMLRTVHQTCAQSGSQSVVTAKVKEWRFDSDEHFRKIVRALLETCGGRCSLTRVAMDMSGEDGDLAPSLDRIDSAGHYEPANIQIVARFANRWKSDDTDANFQRLLALVGDARTVNK